MTTMPRYSIQSGRDYYAPNSAATPSAVGTVGDWLASRRDISNAKLRTPLVLGAQRIDLASKRCDEIQEDLTRIRNRLASAPPWADREIVESLEERAARLSADLHAEHLALWADLKPLLESARDSSVERIRVGWLNEFSRIVEPGDRQ